MNLFQLEVKQQYKTFSEYFYILTQSETPNISCVKIEWEKYKFIGIKLYAELNEKLFIDGNQKLLTIEVEK